MTDTSKPAEPIAADTQSSPPATVTTATNRDPNDEGLDGIRHEQPRRRATWAMVEERDAKIAELTTLLDNETMATQQSQANYADLADKYGELAMTGARLQQRLERAVAALIRIANLEARPDLTGASMGANGGFQWLRRIALDTLTLDRADRDAEIARSNPPPADVEDLTNYDGSNDDT